MRLEGVAVQPYDGKDTASFCNIFADGLIAAVVESPLRQYDCHTPARFQEIKVAFYEKNISADALLCFAILHSQIIAAQNLSLLNLSSKWRICHQNIEIELSEIITDT